MGTIKKIAVGLFLVFTTTAHAEVTLLVPQQVGGGTSVWASIVATELEKYLDEKVVLKHIPSARDIGGFNYWHNNYKDRDDVIMVSHGGNGVSFLTEDVDYNYEKYDSIGLMNLNIIVAKRKDFERPVKFAAGSGMTPEAYAITMLECGPDMDVVQYTECFKDKVVWVNGMSGGERRLAFRRGELNATRENPAAYKKHVESDGNAEVWFHHGILTDGKHVDDYNYQGYQFEDLFKEKWGVYPSGHFYDAYKLVKSFRDGMQKALWVHKGNPRRQEYVDALIQVASNVESAAIIHERVGEYNWYTGDWGNKHRDDLMELITVPSMNVLIEFNRKALGLDSVMKLNLFIEENIRGDLAMVKRGG